MIKLLIILLLPINLHAQQVGKIIRNQTIMIEFIKVDSLSIITVTNTSSCNVLVEIAINGSITHQQQVKSHDHILIHRWNSFILSARSTSPCPPGTSTDWVHISSDLDILQIKTPGLIKHQPDLKLKTLNCDKKDTPGDPGGPAVGTRMPKI